MILLDYSQVIFGQVFMDLKRNGGTASIELIRHLVLNQIGTLNKRFRDNYGRMIICIDTRNKYWRKEYFQYYKWKRAKDRDDSDIDWSELFPIMSTIRQEIIDSVPLLTFEVDGYEADDLIAILATEFRNEKHMIVSSDHDFKQLQLYPNIKQWSPLVNKFVKCDDPDFYRFDHTIRGDRGDGIPNIYSPEDFFPRKAKGELKAQKPVFAKKVDALWEGMQSGKKITELLTEEQAKRFDQNSKLISLTDITNKHRTKAIDVFYDTIQTHLNTRYNLYGYMMNNRLRILMENLEEFQGRGEYPDRDKKTGLEIFT